MHGAFLTGRIIIGLYYLYSAINHFAKLDTMAGYAASKGVPLATVAVAGSGVLLLIAGLTLLSGWHPKVGVAALVLFFVPVTFMMHAFWKVSDPMARMAEMVNFTKNLALLGSTLMFLAIPEPWPLSVHPRARVRTEAHA
jgi:uncharacterized membrane protein YphA (DoxX/SURF4 family)